MKVDVAIVGGGPAGLAAAIESARRGYSTLLFERQSGPADKACGEGVGARGIRALQKLGAFEHLNMSETTPFRGIRFLQPGASVAASFWTGDGLGIRRTALVGALAARASQAGAKLCFGSAVRSLEVHADEITLVTDDGAVCARLVVAADGARSRLREELGIGFRAPNAVRLGLRRHFAVAPWSDEYVDIHWSDGVEAYVTPVGPKTVGVALLGRREVLAAPSAFDRAIERFPTLRAHLRGASYRSSLRGAGPLGGVAERPVAGRALLLGDAAGAVDPISGEGLTLAFQAALTLGHLLPGALKGSLRSAAAYERAWRWRFNRARAFSAALLVLARHPAWRARLLRALDERPWAFRGLLALAG